MDYLWAPWRGVYLKQINKPSSRTGCFICQARRYVSKPKDKNNLVVARTKAALAMMNRYPYNTGHLLIAPQQHKGDLEDLSPQETEELFDLLKDMKQRLARVLKPHGFNIGMNLGRVAGAGLRGHLHIHLVPRWGGDTNFMPIISETKVLSQSLQALYKQLTSSVSNRKGH